MHTVQGITAAPELELPGITSSMQTGDHTGTEQCHRSACLVGDMTFTAHVPRYLLHASLVKDLACDLAQQLLVVMMVVQSIARGALAMSLLHCMSKLTLKGPLR